MTRRRWLYIIPAALVMYTISCIDRTNISLALDPNVSSMLRDLMMDDKMKGEAAGLFFFGYLLLQMPGGHLASRWIARKHSGRPSGKPSAFCGAGPPSRSFGFVPR